MGASRRLQDSGSIAGGRCISCSAAEQGNGGNCTENTFVHFYIHLYKFDVIVDVMKVGYALY
jgi:hypothetical protein